MKCKHNPVLFCVAVLMLLCISCQNKTGVTVRPSVQAIDISDPTATGPYKLSKGNKDRVVWINKSSGALYICTNPTNSPFEAYGWLVPPYATSNDERKSGKIRDGVTPPPGGSLSFDFYSSATICVVPPAERPRSNPKIIIQP